jgi:hypothetical protein
MPCSSLFLSPCSRSSVLELGPKKFDLNDLREDPDFGIFSFAEKMNDEANLSPSSPNPRLALSLPVEFIVYQQLSLFLLPRTTTVVANKEPPLQVSFFNKTPMMNRISSSLLIMLFAIIMSCCAFQQPSRKGLTCPFAKRSIQRRWTTPRLYSSSSDEEINYDQEETLMQLHLSVLPDVSVDDAYAKVSKYTQSFPFAVVLPVQPLQYLPAMEDGGVKLLFLRKKTTEKSGIDGGMRFFLTRGDNGNNNDDIYIVCKRNSKGQTVPKMFSEKLVVQTFVKWIAGESPGKTTIPAPMDVVAIESVFHQWM